MTSVVVGAGVAGLSAAQALARAGREVLVLERSDRVGGLVESEVTADGVLLEHGADGLLVHKKGASHALARLALDREIVREGPAPRRAWVAGEEGLRPIPDGLFALRAHAALELLTSDVLTLAGRARLLAEPLVPRRRVAADESVASFVARRFGAQMVDRLFDPLLAGVYGARADRLGVQAAMPKLVELERTHGSVAWGVARRPPLEGDTGLVTLRGGMSRIADVMAARLGARVALGVEVRGVELRRERVALGLADGTHVDADELILAVPSHVAARLLATTDPHLAAELAAIEHVSVDVVSLAYGRDAARGLPVGTGVVVAPALGMATHACTFASEKWHGRAPAERFVVRAVLAGSERSPADVVAHAREELGRLIGLEAEPLWSRVKRRPRALPVYGVGHRDRAARVRRWAQALGPIALAGNAYDGLGVADCLESGVSAAEQLIQRAASRVGASTSHSSARPS